MSLILDGTAGVTGPATKVIVGTTTNDSATAGYVGEYVDSYVSSVTVALAATVTNVTSISLTAGDWDVSALIYSASGGANTYGTFGISQTSATFAGSSGKDYTFMSCFPAVNVVTGCIPCLRVSLASTTTIYFVANMGIAQITTGVNAHLSARRVR
jgi:hypothetical protein